MGLIIALGCSAITFFIVLGKQQHDMDEARRGERQKYAIATYSFKKGDILKPIGGSKRYIFSEFYDGLALCYELGVGCEHYKWTVPLNPVVLELTK